MRSAPSRRPAPHTVAARFVGFVAACLALAVGSLPAAQAYRTVDWPQWRGPARNGITPEKGWRAWGKAGPPVLWTASVGTGFSSFAVAAGRLYTGGNAGNTDTVYCLDARTGAPLWRHRYVCPLQPLSYEGGPSATPAVSRGRVYTISKAGHCFCLDARSGSVIWSRELAAPPRGPEDYPVFWGFAGSPLVLGDAVILAVGTAGIALSTKDGRTLWDNGPGRPGYSSPVPFRAGSRTCVAFLSGHEVVAAEADSGRVPWKIPWRTTWDQNAPDVIVSGQRLFVSTGHNVGCALFDLASGAPVEVWRNKNMRNELSSSVLWKAHLYGFDGPRLRCLRWETGEVAWSADGAGPGSLLVADGKLVLLREDGRLTVAEASPEAYRPLAEAPILSGRCWPAPVLAGGRLYARNAAGTVVCVDLRPRAE